MWMCECLSILNSHRLPLNIYLCHRIQIELPDPDVARSYSVLCWYHRIESSHQRTVCAFLSLSATLFIAIISNLSLLSWLTLPSPESFALLHFSPNLVYFNSNSNCYDRPCCHMGPPEYYSSSGIEHELLNAWAVFCNDCLQRKYPENKLNFPNSLSSLGLDSIKNVGG